MIFPDPVLTANIYGSSLLDEMVRQVISPFQQEVRARDAQGLCCLWFMRYARGGEHLKVRLHGPSEIRPWAKELLEATAEQFCAGVIQPSSRPQRSRWDAPPIDLEDEKPGTQLDCGLLWTHYRRSPVSLGGKPFLLDNRYVALLTACLGRGAEIVLEAFATGDRTAVARRRPATLLRLLITGLSAAGLNAEGRSSYLVFHRDCLLRFSSRGQEEDIHPAQIIANFDSQTSRMEATLASLRRIAHEEWEEGDAKPVDAAETAWGRAVAALIRYVRPLCGDPEYYLDPLAVDPVFPPLFKVCHGVANQLGLVPLEEAFVYHLLV